MPEYIAKQQITTPNGPGTVETELYDQGTHFILVRHKLAEMTGFEAGRRVLRTATTCLWAYEVGELEGEKA